MSTNDSKESRAWWRHFAFVAVAMAGYGIGSIETSQLRADAKAARRTGYAEGRASCSEPTRAGIITDAAKGWLLSPPSK